MASKYAAAYTNAYQTDPPVMADANKVHGKLRVLYDSYALTADLSLADKIYFGKLPKGARVIDCILAFTALGAGNLDVGYEYNKTGEAGVLTNDADAFLAAAAVTSAGTVGMIEQNNMVGMGYEIEGEADIVVSVQTDTSASSGTIKLAVYYVVE